MKPVMTVAAESPCAEAIETMRDKGFDQLPVATTKGNRLVGLVTLGNLLSYISNGRATPESPVSDVMFDFRKLSETVSDPSDLGTKGKDNLILGEDKDKANKRKKFVEITRDTPLSALSRFFEWNSAAVVTEKDDQGHMKAVGVVTKVDLLSWLVKQGKSNGVNGSH